MHRVAGWAKAAIAATKQVGPGRQTAARRNRCTRQHGRPMFKSFVQHQGVQGKLCRTLLGNAVHRFSQNPAGSLFNAPRDPPSRLLHAPREL